MGYAKRTQQKDSKSKLPIVLIAIAGIAFVAFGSYIAITSTSKAEDEKDTSPNTPKAQQTSLSEPTLKTESNPDEIETNETPIEESVKTEAEEVIDPFKNVTLKKAPPRKYVAPPNPKHPADLLDQFAYEGAWENNDFNLITFAGFHYGRDQYSKPGSLGECLWTVGNPVKDSGIHRSVTVDLEKPFLVFDQAELDYSFESRQMARLRFKKILPENEENYETFRAAFSDCVDILCDKFGMTYPTNRSGGLDEAASYIFSTPHDSEDKDYGTLNARSGNCDIVMGFRQVYGKPELELYFYINNKDVYSIMKHESQAEMQRRFK